MSKNKPSFFEYAWYLNRTFTTTELVETVSKLASVPKICRDDRSNSSNRLIFSTPNDFALPGFLRKTIGGNTTASCLYTVIQAASPDCWSLEHALKMMTWVIEQEEMDDLRKVSIERARFEFQFREIPVVLVYIPEISSKNAEGVACNFGALIFEPLGALDNSLDERLSYDLGFCLDDTDGVGYTANAVLNEFFGKFDDFRGDNPMHISIHSISCKLENNDVCSLIRRLIEISASDNCQFLQSQVKYKVPPQIQQSSLDSFLNFLQNEKGSSTVSEGQMQLSYFMHWGVIFGFVADGMELTDEAYQNGLLKGRDLEKYQDAHSNFLKEYVEWVAATAHMDTVSGAIPAYCLAFDWKTRIRLIVLPVGDQFILCQTPLELKKKFKPSAAISSVFGSMDNWVQGVPPIEDDLDFPVLNDKEDYGIGEATMPARSPFAFQDPFVWVRKLKEELRKKGRSKSKESAKTEAGSLDEQIENLIAAGLALSPGITAMDFLLLDSEEEYRKNPYVSVFWRLTERSSDGVIFSPQALYHSRDDPSEEQMMEDFQRLCGEECRIENIGFEYYPLDDPEGHWLKYVRFTANGDPVEWFLGPDATAMGGLQILVEYFQSFFKERFKDRLLYETSAEYVLLCLSAEVAERIGKLSPLSEHPERE
jgi:hypothetical protein